MLRFLMALALGGVTHSGNHCVTRIDDLIVPADANAKPGSPFLSKYIGVINSEPGKNREIASVDQVVMPLRQNTQKFSSNPTELPGLTNGFVRTARISILQRRDHPIRRMKRYERGAFNLESGCAAVIFVFKVHCQRLIRLYVGVTNLHSDVGPQLPPSGVLSNLVLPLHSKRGFASVFDGLSSKLDLNSQEPSTDRGYRSADTRDYQDPKSPVGHLPLGAQILLAALGVVGGSYGFLNTLLKAGDRSTSWTIGNTLVSVGGILCGVAIALSVLTGR